MLLGFLVGHPLGMEPGVVALAGSLVMILVCRMDMHHTLERVEWNVVFFFTGLFMLIGALEHNGAIEMLSHLILDWTGGDFALTLLAVLWFAGIASAIVDNIDSNHSGAASRRSRTAATTCPVASAGVPVCTTRKRRSRSERAASGSNANSSPSRVAMRTPP